MDKLHLVQNVNNLVDELIDEYDRERVWETEAARALSDLLLGTRRENISWMSDVLHCVDGFSVSVQASVNHYCSPKSNHPKDSWTSFELGFPTEVEPLLFDYKDGGPDDEADYTDTVYPNVPAVVVLKVLAKHGGLRED